MNQIIKIILTFLVIIFIGNWIYFKNQNQDFKFNLNQLFQEINFMNLIISIFLFSSTNLLRSFRFYYLIKKNLKKNYLMAFQTILGSYPLAFFFTGSGLLFRSFYLKKSEVSLKKTISFFALEKLIDLFFITILLIFLGFTFYSTKKIWFKYTNYIYFLFFSCFLFMLIIYGRLFFLTFFFKITKKISSLKKWRRKITYLKIGLDDIFKFKKSLTLISLSFIIWILDFFFIFYLLRTFNPHFFLYESFIIFILIQLSVIIPIAPSGLGIWESAFLLADNFLESEKLNLLPLSLVSHLTLTLFYGILLLIVFYQMKLNFNDFKKIYSYFKKNKL